MFMLYYSARKQQPKQEVKLWSGQRCLRSLRMSDIKFFFFELIPTNNNQSDQLEVFQDDWSGLKEIINETQEFISVNYADLRMRY